MKKFILRLLLFLLPVVAGIVVVQVTVDWDGMQGDLGRMMRVEFHKATPTADMAAPHGRCTDVSVAELPVDTRGRIMVFGDSFSEKHPRWGDSAQYRWHTYTAGTLGKEVINIATFLEERFAPLAVFCALLHEAPQWLADTVVVESVEREVANRLSMGTAYAPPTLDDIKQRINTHSVNPEAWHRRIPDYLRKRIIPAPTVCHQTLRQPLFTCFADTLFHYFEDTIREHANKIDAATAEREYLDSLATTHGITLLWLIIPDKLTAYEPYLQQPPSRPSLLADSTNPLLQGSVLNPLPLLRTMIAEGTMDVYPPDESHFSWLAAAKVGQEVARRLGLDTCETTSR